MRLIILTSFALIAFAGNSLINRWALLDGSTGPLSFTALRLCSGALLLWLLVAARSGLWWPKFNPISATALFIYAIGFSLAYVSLDVGWGALVLFGGVQLTMFSLAVLSNQEVGLSRIFGAIISFVGLCFLLMPNSAVNINFFSLAFMFLAAIAWGLYTYRGHSSSNPLSDTAQNFFWAAPFSIILYFITQDDLETKGAMLAVVSGTVTSGIGYAVWYAVLPKFRSTTAAILQLLVPLIAAGFGSLFLAEALTWQLAFATAFVFFGTFVALRRPGIKPLK